MRFRLAFRTLWHAPHGVWDQLFLRLYKTIDVADALALVPQAMAYARTQPGDQAGADTPLFKGVQAEAKVVQRHLR